MSKNLNSKNRVLSIVLQSNMSTDVTNMSGLCIQCTPNTVHFNISSFVTNTSNHQNQYFDPVKFPVKVKTNTGNWATLGLFLSRSFYPVEPRSVPADGISISLIAIIEGWRKLEIYLLKKPIYLFCVVPKKNPTKIGQP